MTEDELIKRIEARFKHLFHFTDDRNLPAVRKHGLLSRRELNRRNVACARYGGNELSRRLDDEKGLDDYVHLSFCPNHPLEYVARVRTENPIGPSTTLRIDPSIIRTNGVLYCATVSNRADASLVSLKDVHLTFDLEVLFDHLKWSDPAIQLRYRRAEKYEVLVPKEVGLTYIKN